jgi:hypothetical protein
MHAVSLSNVMDFSFFRENEIFVRFSQKRKFSRNEISRKSSHFRIFAKIEKCIFVSALAQTLFII